MTIPSISRDRGNLYQLLICTNIRIVSSPLWERTEDEVRDSAEEQFVTSPLSLSDSGEGAKETRILVEIRPPADSSLLKKLKYEHEENQ